MIVLLLATLVAVFILNKKIKFLAKRNAQIVGKLREITEENKPGKPEQSGEMVVPNRI
jgi:F0F1-type ATP synthase membrane subunit b/b'